MSNKPNAGPENSCLFFLMWGLLIAMVAFAIVAGIGGH